MSGVREEIRREIRREENAESVINLMQSLNCTFEKAANLLKIPEADLDLVRELVYKME